MDAADRIDRTSRMDLPWRLAKRWLGGLASGARKRPRVLSVVERLDLGPKRSLWIVACAGRRFLVPCGAEAVGPMLEIHPRERGSNDRVPLLPEASILWMEN